MTTQPQTQPQHLQLTTPAEYEILRARLDRSRAWVDAYFAEHGGNSYPSDIVPPDQQATNEQRGAVEQYEFRHRIGDTGGAYFCYAQPQGIGFHWSRRYQQLRGGDLLTCWTGRELARVTWAGNPYRCPAIGGSSVRQNFRARGIDGRDWAGTYYTSSGDYCRMRPTKHQQATT